MLSAIWHNKAVRSTYAYWHFVGDDHVGIGADFDGVPRKGLPMNLYDVSQYPNLIEELLRRGYAETSISKVLSGNLFRYQDKFIPCRSASDHACWSIYLCFMRIFSCFPEYFTRLRTWLGNWGKILVDVQRWVRELLILLTLFLFSLKLRECIAWNKCSPYCSSVYMYSFIPVTTTVLDRRYSDFSLMIQKWSVNQNEQ